MQRYDPETKGLTQEWTQHLEEQGKHLDQAVVTFIGHFTAAALQACEHITVSFDANTDAKEGWTFTPGEPRLNGLVVYEDDEYKLGTPVHVTMQDLHAATELGRLAVDRAHAAVLWVIFTVNSMHYDEASDD